MGKTGHTSNGYGSLLIERQICGVNIRRASGTKSPDELAEILTLLEALGKTGRADLIEAVAAGHYRGIYLLHLSQGGKPFPPSVSPAAARAPLGATLVASRRDLKLAEAVNAMIAGKPGEKRYLKELKRHLMWLADRHPKQTVRDLCGVLIKERERHTLAGHLSAFTRLRADALVLAAWADGGAHGDTWQEIAATIITTPVSPRLRRTHKPFTPWDVMMLRARFDEERPGAGDMFTALCFSGMRPSEYFDRPTRWSLGSHSLFIRGTKTLNAVRTVPAFAEIVEPKISFSLFGQIFREVMKDVNAFTKNAPYPHTPYDCRRTFAHWCDFAGIPRGRVAHYLGHSASTITDFYAFTKPTGDEIARDAKKLADFIRSHAAEEVAKQEIDGSSVTSPQNTAHKRFEF